MTLKKKGNKKRETVAGQLGTQLATAPSAVRIVTKPLTIPCGSLGKALASIVSPAELPTVYAYNCIVEGNSAFNSAAIPYHAITGPNSNTYASTMLTQCGAPVLKPAIAIIAPGWIVP